ncbi:MAG: hypothetical protein NE330_10195 [Lentisphaeraceae bacterium]|nr:hypothetical protein [Lentisphaeraceae bacterium]
MNQLDKLVSELNAFQTRSAAKKELLSMGSDKIGPYLIQRITEPGLVDNAVWAIAGIFGEWKFKDSAGVLIELLYSRKSLQSDLARTLNKITGMDFGADPEAWKHYLSGSGVFFNIRSAFSDDEIINFSVTDGYCKVYLPTPNDRKHEVLVYEKEDKLTVYTECGYIMSSQISAVQDLAAKVEHSQIVCEEDGGRTKVTLTAEWSGSQIDFNLLKEQIIYFASFADDLENQLTGEDNI